ncbi:HAMP domain-containing histidine kinase [Bacillus sp. CMF21]|uniref:HAMP domain-containing sensor histidine kinase n=1 Tax=Metabacillus dongyingensis TaxID=2874282 RepID=UPI001CBC750E|nr:HAMP domain-containing sensor histidine kinase [Metabacillus dongyingensis]UAL51961.1 HAMP domain-containing histidine kinase [Metabacillus dongyingensis]UOK57764.1 HAMP domain-containing histidine kinase [Bacillus sp. OVS6]USK28276.1 HAMP domain-containing histidine kinase [Bacillus sp. CMF21]
MRIKYIYQLFLSHISILIIAFMILSLVVAQYAESFVYEDKVEELEQYGNRILTDVQNNRGERALKEYEQVLSARGIRFSLFDDKGMIFYPYAGNAPRFQPTEEEWQNLKEGERIVVKHEIKRFNQEVSLVALPYLENGNLSGGILLVSPIKGSRETISEINRYLLYTILISLSVSLLLSWFLSNVHVKRIQRIRNATSMIAEGKYDISVPSSNIDEIGELANDFNNMAEQLKQSNQEIESLENRRRKFMADVSHELRTPLTTISGVIEGLKNNMIEEGEKEKGIQLVSQEAKRLIRLVNENLDYEKIRSNQVKLFKEEIQLTEAFEIIKEHLFFQAEEKQVELKIDGNEEITVFADYDRLIQILINITKNSIQFTESGTVWLRGKKGYKETIIEIEDTGIGMDPKEVESIWQRFYKADMSRTGHQFGEFGLGLSIVKQLVHLHQGEIVIDSRKDHGTKFILKFPDKKHDL